MKLDPFPGTLTKQAVASGRQLAGKVMKREVMAALWLESTPKGF